MEAGPSTHRATTASALEVFWVFLRLGLTSFGGPIAHLGYFRTEFVERRRWLEGRAFGDLVALCQFLPGPASSQVSFALGLLRVGPLGALAAWIGFTLPSTILMILAGYGADVLTGPASARLIHGLKLTAVAVVAQAVFGMAQALAPDRVRAVIAVGALALVAAIAGGAGQLTALTLGAGAGVLLCSEAKAQPAVAASVPSPVTRLAGAVSLALFFGLLLGLPALAALTQLQWVRVSGAFYRSGALVFGGGHVVLPLLQAQIVQPGWVAPGRFLGGYALAQALPGPLFTFAAYLGTVLHPGPSGVGGGLLALVAIFLPGLLILIGVLPFWRAISTQRWARAAMTGANAAVVGILAAALYNPVWITSVFSMADFVLVALAFVGLQRLRIAPVWVVMVLAGLGLAGF